MKNLRAIRERQGLSQVRLAVLAGLTAQSVCQYEAGEQHPSWAAAIRIADALGCSLDELAGRIEPTHVVAERDRAVRRLGEIARIAAQGVGP